MIRDLAVKTDSTAPCFDRAGQVFLALGLLLGMAGCGREERFAEPDVIRAVRTIVVEQRAPGRIVRFPGVVEPTDSAMLSFAVDGTVHTIDVDLGDRVEQDQQLAVLDDEPYVLIVDARRAEMEQAQAQLHERAKTFERQELLFERQVASESDFDTARASYQTAQKEVEAAERRFRLAERDVRDTRLAAPFAGTITQRMVEEHEELPAGQPVFELQVERGCEVEVLMPETLVLAIEVGDAVSVDVPAQNIRELAGHIIEIGRRAVVANTFPVTVALGAGHDAWAGMTAEVAFTFRHPQREPGYLLPVSAVLLEGPHEDAAVFVFDPDTSTVQRRAVEVGTIHNGQVELSRGVGVGDRVVTAGVEFLRDGQKVRLHDPERAERR